MSGSCHCEREMSNYLAAQQDWSFMTLELGVNMRDHMSPDEFRERTGYLLDQLVSRHPEKPVAVITIYPNFAGFPGSGIAEKDVQFNDILRSHVKRLDHPKLSLIEGNKVLDDLAGLSCDLIHPGMRDIYGWGESGPGAGRNPVNPGGIRVQRRLTEKLDIALAR